MRLANKTFFNNSLFEKLLGIFLFIIGGGFLFTDFENLSIPRIFATVLFFFGGGILEWKFIAKQNEINVLINKNDVSNSFNKIIEVNEGIINNLENISKEVKDGDILFLKGKSSVYDVTLTDNDKLDLDGDFTFTHSDDMIQLVRISGKWKELSRTDNP